MQRRQFLLSLGVGAGAIAIPLRTLVAAISESFATSADQQSDRHGRDAAWDGMLAAGQFIPAKMPLNAARVVLPRPDAETSSRAYHRNAHVGVPLVLPIVVQGGSWPFVYELIAAPPGATLGRNYGDPDYGVVRWTPTSNAPFAFTVRVRDQDGGSVQFSWSGVTTSTWLRFVDAVNGSDSTGTGARTAPWRSLAYAYAHVQDGGGLCLRAGNYQSPTEAMNIAVSGGSGAGRIGSLFGWPGESVHVDCSSLQAPNFAWYNSSDTFVAQLALIGGASGYENPRYFASLAVNHRCYQYALQFDSPAVGTALNGGDDNNSCLFLGAAGAIREYVAQVGCTFRRLHETNNGFSGIDTYQTRYLVVADNIYDIPASPNTSRHALWIKGWEQEDVTVRGNRWTHPWGGSLIEVSMSASAGAFSARRFEICYNTLLAQPGASAMFFGNAPTGAERGPIWVYRNTVVGLPAIARRSWPLQISFENDVVVHDVVVQGGTTSGNILLFDNNAAIGVYYDPALRENITLSTPHKECHARSTDGVLDAQLRLQGAWRAQYLGTHGAEIATPDVVFANGFQSASRRASAAPNLPGQA